VGVNIGGRAGGSGPSGDVTVKAGSSIVTSGTNSTAILAQSTTGGGGSAKGSGTAAGVDFTGNVNVTVGGTGGATGEVADVLVEAAGEISTAGAHALGILAQSVSGGGGSGGFAASGSVNIGTPLTDGVTGQAQADVGGNGGRSGPAGVVTVQSTGPISTSDFGAIGILAQSVGGGGGHGGHVYSGNLDASTDAQINVDVDIGGKGGAAGDGDLVDVSTAGRISTAGINAPAVVAQSVGGGGGAGGTAYAVVGKALQGSTESAQYTMGGAGGGGGDSGPVNVNGAAAVTTARGGSDALHAQSVGGGGGRGGNAAYMFINLNTPAPKSDKPWRASVTGTVGLGGEGGGAGDGGGVDVVNTGRIDASGTRSRGIVA
jgi:hypothetical protein